MILKSFDCLVTCFHFFSLFFLLFFPWDLRFSFSSHWGILRSIFSSWRITWVAIGL
jgi:hypothetical protein